MSAPRGETDRRMMNFAGDYAGTEFRPIATRLQHWPARSIGVGRCCGGMRSKSGLGGQVMLGGALGGPRVSNAKDRQRAFAPAPTRARERRRPRVSPVRSRPGALRRRLQRWSSRRASYTVRRGHCTARRTPLGGSSAEQPRAPEGGAVITAFLAVGGPQLTKPNQRT